MGYSHYDRAVEHEVRGMLEKSHTKRPLTKEQIWAVRLSLDRESRLRDQVLFDLAIDSNLRGCDLVRIEIGDLAVLAVSR